MRRLFANIVSPCILSLTTHLCISDLIPSVLRLKCIYFSSVSCAPHAPYYLSLLNFIARRKSVKNNNCEVPSLCKFHQCPRRGSSVRAVTGHGLNDRSLHSHHVQTDFGNHAGCLMGNGALSPEIMGMGSWTKHSSPSGAENTRTYTSTPLYVFMVL
jgi:hypothetical protein